MDVGSSEVGARIRAAYGGAAAIYCSRGTSALFALFSALRNRDGPGEVIVPAICCETVALAAQFAGHRVVIADVDRDSGCISLEHVKALLNAETRAVVLVYIFGALVDPLPWKELLKGHGACLVEDICQAVGGVMDNGIPAGNFGDVTLLSFADDKIIAGDGGALVIRNAALCEDIVKCAQELPAGASGTRLELKSLSWRNFCHGLYDLHRAEQAYEPAAHFTQMAPLYRDIFIRRAVPNWVAIEQGWDGLDNERNRRQSLVAKLNEGIAPLAGMRILKSVGQPMWWRFTFLTPGRTEATALTSRLRNAGLPASNHYFPLHLLFGVGNVPVAADFGMRSINLWVDDRMNDHRLRLAISIVAEFAFEMTDAKGIGELTQSVHGT